MAKILLVDDEKHARLMYGDFLTGAGHAVTAVGSIEESKAALEADHFDCVVTDLILPGGDGMQVLEFTKDRHPGVEVIVITALDKVDPAVRAIKSGAAEYLVKPVAPEALAHAVSRALTTRQLLRENADLRRHVALLETGQRVATTLERDRLLAAAASAFTQLTLANGVILFVRQGEQLKQESSHGLGVEEMEDLSGMIRPALEQLRGPEAQRGKEIFAGLLPEPFETALGVTAVDGEAELGAALLFFKGPVPDDARPASAYLAKHFGLALKNLGRFAAVEDLAYLDDLTHLFNTRYLELVLERELTGAKQTNKPFSLLFLDLDYFKSVNDTHGHVVGSKLLVEVARLVKGCVRDNDVVVRYGGDEYVVLLRGTDSGGALKVGERIRRTIETHHFLAREGFGLTITTCIGVASFPEHAQDKETLLDFADRAMYRGKKGTRNVIYLASKGLEATPPQRHAQKVCAGEV